MEDGEYGHCDCCDEYVERDPLTQEQWSRVLFLLLREADEQRKQGRHDLAEGFEAIIRAVRR
jgi:hypothetical protein